MRNRIGLTLVLVVMVALVPVEAISTTMIDLLTQVRVAIPAFSSIVVVDSGGQIVVAGIGTGLELDESVSPPTLNAIGGGGGGSISPRTVYYMVNGMQVSFGTPSVPQVMSLEVYRNGLLQIRDTGLGLGIEDYTHTWGSNVIQFLSPPGDGDSVTIQYLEM